MAHKGFEHGNPKQKQPLPGVFQNRCSERVCNINRKTPVLESLFDNKVAGLQAWNFIKKRLQCWFFSENIVKCLRILYD